MKYLKLFNSTTEYDTFKNGEEYILPNVSYVANDKVVMFTPAPKEDIVFSYNACDSSGWGEVTWVPMEYTVPQGTTFAEWIEMTDEFGNKYATHFPCGCDDNWVINTDGYMMSGYAPNCIGMGSLYLLNADGSLVKGTDVIEARHYELDIPNLD